MSKRNKKWESFKANSSNLNVTNVSTAKADVPSDWRRSCSGVVNINGVPLSNLAAKFNSFAKEDDVLDFFEKEILKDFTGNENQKKEAVDYLKISFHQGGLLFPVAATLATEIKNKKGGPIGTIGNQDFNNVVNIKTTTSGFKIQEYCDVQRVKVLPSDENPLSQYSEDSESQYVNPEKGKKSVIKAEATIAIDFSKDSKNPFLTIESNHMNIMHAGLKSHLDNRSFGQKIADFFKNLFGLNRVRDISSQDHSRHNNELENDNDDPYELRFNRP